MTEDRYYYGQEADMHTYIQLPKILLDAPEYQHLSAETILLYALMLDRMQLSRKNGWQDKAGRTYIYYTTDEAMKRLHVRSEKVTKMYRELESAKLIERKKQGQGKPAMIYILRFANRNSKHSEIENQESRKSKRIYKMNKTDMSNPDISINRTAAEPGQDTAAEPPSEGEIENWEKTLETQLPETPPGIRKIMANACGQKSTRIGGVQKPADDIQAHFRRLTDEDIADTLKHIPARITARNRKSYILTALYTTAEGKELAAAEKKATLNPMIKYVNEFHAQLARQKEAKT